jgi:hypothetical protein
MSGPGSALSKRDVICLISNVVESLVEQPWMGIKDDNGGEMRGNGSQGSDEGRDLFIYSVSPLIITIGDGV